MIKKYTMREIRAYKLHTLHICAEILFRHKK
jgi:hypothetical protein